MINGKTIKGYVDFGSGCVAIRKSEAEDRGLTIAHKRKIIRGYGNGRVETLGSTTFTLKVDEAEVDVEADVVPDNIQTIPILIGQPFTESPRVIVFKNSKYLRIQNVSPEADVAKSRKTLDTATLWVKEATVIPPNYLGHVAVECAEDFTGDIYIQGKIREYGDQLTCIPGVILHLEPGNHALLPVVNISDKSFTAVKRRVIAEGLRCESEITNLTDETEVLRTESENLPPLQIDDIITGPISDIDRSKLLTLLEKYRDCFAQSIAEIGRAKSAEMNITLIDNKPITYRPYRLSINERAKVRSIIEEMLDADIIQESHSPYSSPILLVKKKDGETRLCVDYRKLNNLTVKDHYPLPRIDDQLDRLHGCKYFTSLDLCSGYHQIPMAEGSKSLTSFITPDGQYEYNRMPFGLANAPSIFQRLMNKVLGSMRYNSVTVYLDDILIPSKTIDEGLTHLEEVLQALRDEGLTLKLKKCAFLVTSVNYLGFHITPEGVSPGKQKVKALNEFATPTDVHQVRRFLGLATYFRQFIRNFALIARPLTMLTRKNQVWQWNSEQNEAFETLRNILMTSPVLAIFEPEAPTEVHTDASKHGVAGILLQKQEGKLRPIAYYSRQTTHCEKRYHSYELEVLAVVETLKKFRVYLVGKPFKLVTDCNAMKTAQTKRDLVPRIARWWLQLAEFDFTIEYRPGQRMAHVDALSRSSAATESALEEVDIFQLEVSDWILAGQLTDNNLRDIYKVLSKNKADNAEEEHIRREYILEDGRIYKNTTEGIRWVVPHGLRRDIVRSAHDETGHFSVEKTLNKIRENYWFSGMRAYVQRYIQCCIPCLYNKKRSGAKPGYLHPIEKVTRPFHTLHLDHLGPFVKSSRQNSYIIVAVESFTKYLLLKATRTTETRNVISFLNEIIYTYGTPTRIITDRGTAFTSQKFAKFCEEAGIKHVLNAVATPRANGQVERFNRTILTALKTTIRDENRWDLDLLKIQFAINNTVNKSTGKTASELLYGYKPRATTDAMLTAEVAKTLEDRKELSVLRQEAANKISMAQQEQKKHFDKRRMVAKRYNVGDLVLTQKTHPATGTSQKLLPTYAGPFRVNAVLPNDRYEIVDMPGAHRSARAKYRNIVAVDRMKSWVPPGGLSEEDGDSPTKEV